MYASVYYDVCSILLCDVDHYYETYGLRTIFEGDIGCNIPIFMGWLENNVRQYKVKDYFWKNESKTLS